MTLREKVLMVEETSSELRGLAYALGEKLKAHQFKRLHLEYVSIEELRDINETHVCIDFKKIDEEYICVGVPYDLLANPTDEAVSAFIASERLAEGGDK